MQLLRLLSSDIWQFRRVLLGVFVARANMVIGEYANRAGQLGNVPRNRNF
ncbi:MAG: hypothetical protein AAGB11_03345 [Pseudomonadota bacterium]